MHVRLTFSEVKYMSRTDPALTQEGTSAAGRSR
jgi:hypothetical protein